MSASIVWVRGTPTPMTCASTVWVRILTGRSAPCHRCPASPPSVAWVRVVWPTAPAVAIDLVARARDESDPAAFVQYTFPEPDGAAKPLSTVQVLLSSEHAPNRASAPSVTVLYVASTYVVLAAWAEL